MIKKMTRFIRDICMLMMLVFLGGIALSRQVNFLQAHKKSVIHELDQDFLNQLYVTLKQIHKIKELIVLCEGTECSELLKKLELHLEKLAQLETEYKHNSPGLAFLGPIGTASIVIKEKRISEKLLTLANDLTVLLISLVKDAQNTVIAKSIHETLQNNHELIAKLEQQVNSREISIT